MCIKLIGGGSLNDYPSPLEALLPTLEERVTRLERDMEEQKRLRASQDSDLSDFGEKLRVQQDLIQAIAKTQSEHTKTLSEHTKTLSEHTKMLVGHTQQLHRLEEQVGGLEGSVGTLKNGMEQIIGMLDTLIERDGQR